MRLVELVGYLASGLVFACFYMKAMLPLRLIAIASNLAFIAYGYLGDLTPILILHLGLLPLNVCRLGGTLRQQRQPACAGLSMRLLRRRRVPRREAGAAQAPTPSAPRVIGGNIDEAMARARWV